MYENLVSGFRRAGNSLKLTEVIKLNRLFKRVWAKLEKVLAIACALTVWEAIPRLDLVDTFLLPPFSEVVKSLAGLVASGELFRHFSVSLQRSLTGFLLGIGIAVPLGIFMGRFINVEEIMDPLLQACRNSSVLALYPVFLLFFGLGEVSKTAIIIWGATWPSLLNTISGVKSTDAQLIKAARSMGVSPFALLHKVILPAALPSILTGVRLSAASSILVLVAAEMIGANSGLGFMIFYFEERYAVPEMYAGIITMSLVGLSVNYLLVALNKRLTGWKEKAEEN